MTVRLRLAALVGVAAAGLGCAGAGLATSVLAHTAPSGVVAVDVDPAGSTDSMDISNVAYAFPAGRGEVAPAAPLAARAAATRTAVAAARLGIPGLQGAGPSVVNGPMGAAQPFQAIPGCNASNNNCGLPSCSQSNPGCTLLNCVASAACNPANPGMGNCQPTASGGVLGCGLGASGINDCFIGLGCGLGGFGLGGGCGLFSFSGCGLNGLGLLGPGCTFTGSCPGIGCGFFGGCGHNDCFGFGSFGFFGGEGDDDSGHHGCGSFSDFGFGDLHFHGFRDVHVHFSSSHSGHGSNRH